MKGTRLVGGVLALLWLSGWTPSAARQRQPQTGTATLAGVVRSMDAQPRPVRNALVTASFDFGRQTALTDADGRFVMTAIPSGRVSLRASKAGWLDAAYGANRPGQAGTPFRVADGEAIDGLAISMAPGAVITGLVRDHTGLPAPDVPVIVSSDPAVSADRLERRAVRTDDRGIYRAFGLAPGQYYVAAVPQRRAIGEMTIRPPTAIETRILQLQQRSNPQLGFPRPPPTTPDATRVVGFAPIFYPHGTSAAQAERVTVGIGEERAGIDIALELLPMGRIEGTVVDGSGLPGSSLVVTIAGEDGGPIPAVAGLSPTLEGRPDLDGHFAFTTVPPGSYVLTARRDGAWAATDLVVQGGAVHRVTLALQPTMTVTGRVAFDATGREPPGVMTTNVTASPPPGLQPEVSIGSTPFAGPQRTRRADVERDGTLRITDLVPGEYSIRAMLGPVVWWARSAMIDGVDLLDFPLVIDPGRDLDGLVVTFTDRPSALAGRLEAADGTPAPAYFIAVFPVDPAYWQSGARRLRSTRPELDGRYEIRHLPAGDYYLVALTDLDPEAWQTTAFLEQAAAGAIRVTVAAGETTRQDIRIAR